MEFVAFLFQNYLISIWEEGGVNSIKLEEGSLKSSQVTPCLYNHMLAVPHKPHVVLYLQNSLVAEEKVGSLQVPVKDPVVMEMVDCPQQLY